MPTVSKPPTHLRPALVMLAALIASPLTPAATHAEPASAGLVRSYNQSGLALFAKLAATPGNLVISPYSIGTAMAMAHAGARGPTELQMAKALDYTLERQMIPAANRALAYTITQRPADEGAIVRVANALHLTRFGDRVAPSYKQLLHDQFGAELFSGSDLAAINGWVKRKTDGKIATILSRLDPNSVCVVLNAIYFKGAWAEPFNAKSTRPGDFHLTQDQTVQVPMMQRNGRYRIVRSHGFDTIALPYKGGGLTMVVLLPEPAAGHSGMAIDGKTAAAIVHDVEAAPADYVALSMPKFKTETSANLIPPFKALGMTLPFDADRADFSAITDSTKEADRIHISQIQHKTFIDVDEAGTEAAAATAVEFGLRSAAPPSKRISVDRPFLYMITDKASGAILFVGRVSDPRA